MKIQNLADNIYQKYPQSNVRNNYSQNVRFNGAVTQNKMKNFVPQLGTFIFNTPEINIKNIEIFLKKFKPNLKINLVSPNSIFGRAQAQTIMGLDNMLNPKLVEQCVDLTTDKANSFEEKILLFEWLVHEMTHIYQADLDSDEESINLTYVKYMKDKILQNLSDETLEKARVNSEKIHKLFHELEQEMIKTIYFQGYSCESIHKPIKSLDILDIESAYYRAFGKTARTFIRDFVNKRIKAYDIKDKEIVEKAIRTQANSEVEAYTTSLSAVKEILGIKGASQNDFLKYVFQIISKIDLEEE